MSEKSGNSTFPKSQDPFRGPTKPVAPGPFRLARRGLTVSARSRFAEPGRGPTALSKQEFHQPDEDVRARGGQAPCGCPAASCPAPFGAAARPCSTLELFRPSVRDRVCGPRARVAHYTPSSGGGDPTRPDLSPSRLPDVCDRARHASGLGLQPLGTGTPPGTRTLNLVIKSHLL